LVPLLAAVVGVATPALAGDAKGQFVVKGAKAPGAIAPTHAAEYGTADEAGRRWEES